jgi:transcriptional regulator with XRE-family HTH domain
MGRQRNPNQTKRYNRLRREGLIAHRMAQGIHQETLAEMLGVSRYMITACEIGLRDPSLEMMIKWAKALKLGDPPLSMFIAPELSAELNQPPPNGPQVDDSGPLNRGSPAALNTAERALPDRGM